MESVPVDTDKNGEELTGRKKSRFKQLKTRLFGKLKKKESEGLIKQSQSVSDITAPEGRKDGDDSEDEFTYPQCLGSRALSHDSIFFTDQAQSTEPTRVLSQENVHGKIKALQLKLQQQNLHLGPPPMLIPGKRTEDSGTTSEDDGLPCSPPETSFHERVMHGAVYKYPESRKHLSSLSLAGTGSEEEEQSSSRPLSPVSKLSSQPIISSGSALTTPTAGVDFSSPASHMPTLDNSAARHRMSVKPRNQRASTRGNKAPTVSISTRQRSESISDLDNVLSEEEDDEMITSTETTEHSSPTLETKVETTFPEPTEETVQIQEDKPETHLTPLSAEILKSEESLEPEGRLTMNPLFLQPMSFGSGPPSPSGLPELNLRETELALTANSPILKDNACDVQNQTSEKLVAQEDIQEEASFRLHPVPLPRTKKPKVDIKSSPSQESGLLQFLLASAKNRSKTTGETKQNEGPLTTKSQSINSSLDLQKESKSIDLPNLTQDTKSFRRDAPAPPVMSKPTAGASLKITEHVEIEKLEEDRRSAFGVQLRTTSLSLKYRSEVSRMRDETKRYSLESNTVLPVSEEPFRSMCDSSSKPSLPKKHNSQSQESQIVGQDNGKQAIQNTTGTSKETVSLPDWMSLAREKTRAYHPPLNRFSTNQSPVHPSPPAQPPKPALQPKTQSLTTALHPLKTQPIQTTQKPATKPTSVGTKDKQDKGRSSAAEDDTIKRAATISKMDGNARPIPPNTEALSITSEPPAASSFSSPPDTSQQQHQIQQPRLDGAQPSWMELAKRKSLAWSDKTLE